MLYFGSSNFAGWHLAQAQEAAPARDARAGQRAVAVQPRRAHHRARGAARRAALRHWRDPLVPALRRRARRHPAEDRTRGARSASAPRSGSRNHRPQVEQYEALCGELGERPADVALAWLLARTRGHRTDHRTAHRRPARRQPARARGRARRRDAGRGSTRSGPDRAAPHPRRTPGSAKPSVPLGCVRSQSSVRQHTRRPRSSTQGDTRRAVAPPRHAPGGLRRPPATHPAGSDVHQHAPGGRP